MGKIFQKAVSHFKTILIGLIVGLSLLSCTSVKKDMVPTREWTVKLRDSIAILHINLPLKYDTMHTWFCRSDYSGGDEYYYRIQPSKCSMAEEGCFLRYIPTLSMR
jgi:hypothetical protein